MQCFTRASLERKRDRANARLDSIRKYLRERIECCSKEEFLTLTDNMDRELVLVEQTQRALNDHISQHGCLVQTATSPSRGDS